jgi:SAM-dependent methyltransferase
MRYSKILSEYYDLAYPDIEEKELSFWLKHLQPTRGTALEIGCGTGRILIPLLRKGIRIIGIDASGDMLNRCRSKCKQLGLKTQLRRQSMATFSLTCNLSFVFIPDGTFGFAATDGEVVKTLTNIYNHLLPGSSFMFDVLLHRRDKRYDTGWQGDWKQLDDSLVYAKRYLTEYDLNTRIQTRLIIIEKFVDGSLVGSEENLGRLRHYEIAEIHQFLQKVGFQDIKVTDWLSEKKVEKNSAMATVRCIKPA